MSVSVSITIVFLLDVSYDVCCSLIKPNNCIVVRFTCCSGESDCGFALIRNTDRFNIVFGELVALADLVKAVDN